MQLQSFWHGQDSRFLSKGFPSNFGQNCRQSLPQPGQLQAPQITMFYHCTSPPYNRRLQKKQRNELTRRFIFGNARLFFQPDVRALNSRAVGAARRRSARRRRSENKRSVCLVAIVRPGHATSYTIEVTISEKEKTVRTHGK